MGGILRFFEQARLGGSIPPSPCHAYGRRRLAAYANLEYVLHMIHDKMPYTRRMPGGTSSAEQECSGLLCCVHDVKTGPILARAGTTGKRPPKSVGGGLRGEG